MQAQETPLHIAARTKEGEKCAEMLLKSGADVNATREVKFQNFHFSNNFESQTYIVL